MFSLKPDYEASQRRIEAFWEREVIDRPVAQFTLFKPPSEQGTLPISGHTSAAERWMDPGYHAEWALVNLSNQFFLGDTLPVAWPNLGPDLFAALYGCPLSFGEYGTSWSQPALADWSQAEAVRLDWGSPYLKAVEEITDALLGTGQGKFLTGMTDLHPGGDCLAALRGQQTLALDLLDHPQEIHSMLKRIFEDYCQVYEHFYQKLRSAGLPVTTWTPLISEGKYYLPSCDFSALVSREMFKEFFLSWIAAECQALDRSLYHLDGPGALRHLDCLLAIPELDAIQFVPTPGDGAFTKWAWVYRRIQAAGKGLQVTCELAEIPMVMETLHPEGVYLAINGVPGKDEADALLKRLLQWK